MCVTFCEIKPYLIKSKLFYPDIKLNGTKLKIKKLFARTCYLEQLNFSF